MNSNSLEARLGFKGERGYSAYEIAVQNGYEGSEQDWLATLGTSSHFDREEIVYNGVAGDTEFWLPDSYTNNSFVDVYIEGERLNSNKYTIEEGSQLHKSIFLKTPLDVDNTKVEIIVTTMSTNNLPIVTMINQNSTDEEVPSARAVYGEFENTKTQINERFGVLTGSIAGIPIGGSKEAYFDYPEGFFRENCTILSANSIYADNVYLNIDTEATTFGVLGMPIVTNVVLEETQIHVYMKNTSTEAIMTGNFKINLMKNGGIM